MLEKIKERVKMLKQVCFHQSNILFFTHLHKLLKELQMTEDIKVERNSVYMRDMYNCYYCYSLPGKDYS